MNRKPIDIRPHLLSAWRRRAARRIASAAIAAALLIVPPALGPRHPGNRAAALTTPPPVTASPARVGTLSWLTGCWERRSGPRLVEEQWMAPRGGMMLGMSRTVRGDTLVEYEQLRIYERDGRLVYAAQPSGQTPAEFVSIEVGDTGVVFENPEHDFPQRVAYRRSGADSLLARIEGTHRGKARGVDFPYRRAACPSGSTGR